MPTTPATRSGCSSASCHTTIDAPVVADEHRLLGADVVEQADEVAGQVEDVVVLDVPAGCATGRSPRWSGASTR